MGSKQMQVGSQQRQVASLLFGLVLVDEIPQIVQLWISETSVNHGKTLRGKLGAQTRSC